MRFLQPYEPRPLGGSDSGQRTHLFATCESYLAYLVYVVLASCHEGA